MTSTNAAPPPIRRVMLLETNGGMRVLLRSVLAGFGCDEVSAYGSARAALDELHYVRPDLAVVDDEVDGGSGLAFVEELRRLDDPALRATPVVMLTGRPSVARIRTFVNAGVDEVLAKPVRPDALYERIDATARRPRPYVEIGDFYGPDRRRADRPHGEDERRGAADDDRPSATG